MSEQELTQLITELGLDQNDARLRTLLLQILAARPDAQLTPEFKQRLRQELSSRIVAQSTAASISNSSTAFRPTNKINYFTKTMQRILVPVLVVALIVVGGGVWYTSRNNPGLINLGDGGQILSGKYSVDELAAGSFGDLSKVAIVSAGTGGGLGSGGQPEDGAQLNTRLAQQGQLGTTPTAPPDGRENTVGDVAILPVPEGFDFSYEGDDLTDLTETYSVLKRTKPEQSESVVNRIVRMFSFGLIDMSKFTNTRIQNFAFQENHEYGLAVNVDLHSGSVSMYQNWETWPQPRYVCEPNGYCGTQPQLTPEDLPSDEEAVRIANQFVRDYGISLDGYAEPKVYEYYPWRVAYEQTADRSSFYIPEAVNVLYPLMLEGQMVYDESGHPVGMNINVDARTRRVNNVYGLDSKQFQKSNYAGETNAQRLIEVAERGGYRNWGWDSGSNNRTLSLGTPTVQLVRVWYSSDPNRPGEELFVPSLVFPIAGAVESNYWRQNVIVPLVRDLLDNEDQGGMRPMPAVDEPMPVEPDQGIGDTPGSSSGSGAGGSVGGTTPSTEARPPVLTPQTTDDE